MMTRSKMREAAQNFSHNLVENKKIMAKHASIESLIPLDNLT